MRRIWLYVVAFSIALSLLNMICYAACPQPPAGVTEINQDNIDAIIGTPMQPMIAYECCCLVNFISTTWNTELLSSSVDYCCGRYNPGTVTNYYSHSFSVLPIVTSGSKNIDENNDGIWDYTQKVTIWYTAKCTNGEITIDCWEGNFDIHKTNVYKCGAC
jgi:hypothetical protein